MIHIENVSKTYASVRALHEVSMHIGKGSCFGLVGPNGAGKSTLMKILAGIVEHFDGQVTMFEQLLTSSRQDIRRRMGYVPQDICLEETLSARDNLFYFGRLYGLRGKHIKQRVEEILHLVGLVDRQRDIISTYSGGMKRRINIGCALLHDPHLIIMDEPTVGVDPQSRNHIFTLIEQLKEQGKTILYSSHYMEEVQSLCDHIALIDDGKVVEHGSIKHILNKHATPSIYVEAEAIDANALAAFGEITGHKDGYVLSTENPLRVFKSISSYFLTNNIQVDRLELARPSLEDVFLSLTGSRLRDE